MNHAARNGSGPIILPSQKEQHDALMIQVNKDIDHALRYRDASAMANLASMMQGKIFSASSTELVEQARSLAEQLTVTVGLAPSVEWFRQFDNRLEILSTVTWEPLYKKVQE